MCQGVRNRDDIFFNWNVNLKQDFKELAERIAETEFVGRLALLTQVYIRYS